MNGFCMVRLGMVAGLAALCGCTTLTPDPLPARVPVDGTTADVKALQEWRQEARAEQDAQGREIELLRKQVAALEAAFREHQQAVRVQIQDLEAGREKDRAFIVAEMTRKLLALQEEMKPPAPPPAPARTGYEHVVRERETLGAIAKAYNVSVESILKANNLKNANSIRVGQKLFIPD